MRGAVKSALKGGFLALIGGLMFAMSLFLMPAPTQAIGVDEQQLEDPQLEQKARNLFKLYRCLVCQNQSIEDSDAELAADLRAVVRQLVSAGRTPEQIEAFLVDRYGDWVLLKPRMSGLNLLLWLFPLVLLVGGLLLAFLVYGRRSTEKRRLASEQVPTQEKPDTNLSESEQEALNRFYRGHNP